MAIQRWDPLGDLIRLQERMNRLFEETLARSSSKGGVEALSPSGWRPPMDLLEQPERYVVRADLPGVAAADVEVLVEDGRLVLRGERQLEPGAHREDFLRLERPSGRFTLQVALPPSVDSANIHASQKNGVLEVILPKKQESVSGRVEVVED